MMNVTSAALSPHASCQIIGKNMHTLTARGPHDPLTEPPVEPPLPEPSIDNTMTLSSAAAVTDYPFQFARAFVPGEIEDYAQVVLDGDPLPTQCDVKNRWPDGSVKLAILAVVVPALDAGVPATVQFINMIDGNNEPSSVPTIDAEIILTNNAVVSASLQDMLDANDFAVWTSGPIAQTLVCYNRSVDRVYDIGWSAHRSFHPWFVVTHWPGLDKTFVRFVGEITNTEAMEAQTYNLDLTVDGVGVYSQDNITQRVATRWTRTAWHGGAPPAINIYHNVAYLAQTGMVPKYDPMLSIPVETISANYTAWLSTNRAIGGTGWWQPAMSTTGARKDIGLAPSWNV